MKFDNKSRCKSCGDIKTTGSMKSIKVGTALLTCVEQAERDGRLVTGIVDIATELKGCTVNNLLCIMKNSHNEDLQCLLLEAYCREHKVKLIKVDLTPDKTCLNVCNEGDKSLLPDDTNFLLKLPKQYSNEDDFVLTFYKTHQTYIDTFPTVKLCD